MNKEIRAGFCMSLRLLNGAELILFPHFPSTTIQHRCVKSQDATRSFMVVRSREAAEASGAQQRLFSQAIKGFKFALVKCSDCADVCVCFFLSLQKNRMCSICGYSQNVQSNLKTKKSTQVTFIENMVQFGAV